MRSSSPINPTTLSRPLIGATMLLSCLFACCSGTSDTSPDEAEVDGEKTKADPVWAATEAAPAYAFQLTPTGDPVLYDAGGNLLLDLGLVFSGAYGEAEGEAGCVASKTCLFTDQKKFGPWSWVESDDKETFALTAAYKGSQSSAQATWSFQQGDPRLLLTVNLTYAVDTYPDREFLMMTLPDKAAALARDLRFTRLAPGQTVQSDRWTPHQVVAGTESRAFHLNAHGFDGFEVESIKHGTALVMEMDDARNHPFRPVSQCGPDDEKNTVHMAFDRHARKQGETLEFQVEVNLGHTWSPVLSRYPGGHEAAIALLDTAPAQDAGHLSALLWGHSDSEDPRFGNGGILGNGLTLTKVIAATPESIGNGEIARMARLARDQGLRFAGQSAGVDDPSLREAGITALKVDAKAQTWLDDNPRYQCTSFQANGWRNNTFVSLLADSGYTAVWSNLPTRTTPGSLNLMRPERPDVRTPIAWNHGHSGNAFTFFNALDLHQPRLQRRLSRSAISRLARERGLLIARTRFESSASNPTATKPLLSTGKDGGLITSPAFEEILFELSDAKQRGLAWMTTVEGLMSWMKALEHIRLTPLADGRLKVSNDSDIDLKGLTLLLPGGTYQARIDETPVTGRRVTSAPRKLQDTLVWFDVASKSTALLTIEDAQGRRIQPLVPIKWTVHQ